jgi:hypothetical protein
MFYINRTEQFSIYYWTGNGWSSSQNEAKLFNSKEETKAEIEAAGIVYRCRVNKI